MIIFSFLKKLKTIIINNYILSVNLYIGNPKYDEQCMDTGATINAGNFQYYLWVISQYPEMGDEYLQCSKYTLLLYRLRIDYA